MLGLEINKIIIIIIIIIIIRSFLPSFGSFGQAVSEEKIF
jgi:hypothetical protein